MRIGVGVIGMGWMGSVHSRAYRAVPDRFADSGIEPVLRVCADESGARARAGAARFGFARWTTDWRQVVADPEVQVVNVTTPNHLHLEIVQAAAAAGKHILCEKPVGRSPQETAAACRAARQAGVLTCVGFNYRWAPAAQQVRALVRDGQLGDLTHYRGHVLVGYVADPHSVLSWRLRSELAGMGALGDLMSHAIDMALMICGPLRRVVAQPATFISRRPLPAADAADHYARSQGGPTGPVTNEDYVGALAEFANGARGSLEACRVIQGPQSEIGFHVHGRQGAASWEFERMNEFLLFRAADAVEERGYRRVLTGPCHPFHGHFTPGAGVGLGYDDLKVIEAHQFLQSVARGEQAEPGLDQALAVAEVQQAMRRSWDTERWEAVLPL